MPDGARRYASIACFWLGLLGVPAAVVAATGGVSTIGFSIMAIVMIPVTMFGLMPIGIALLFPLLPVIWLLDKLMPKKGDLLMEKGITVGGPILVVLAYVVGFDPTSAYGVRLPTPWPAVGTLMVLGSAFGATAGLMNLAGRLDFP